MFRRALVLLLFFLSCDARRARPQPSELRVASARSITRTYSQSRFARWELRARALGDDCDVLLISTSTVLDDAMVEGLHYGGGSYGVVEGGVHRFYRARTFRGVAYKDLSARVWTYGSLTPAEVPRLKPCR